LQQLIDSLTAAFRMAFTSLWAYLLALLGALGMALLLLWSGEMLRRYPSGWDLHVEPIRLLSILVLAALSGLLLPLQAAALAKARGVAGAAGGSAGAALALLSVSCCAPFIVPAVLSFFGFSGVALLSFNAAVRQISTPLILLSICLMALSVVFVTRTLAAACRLPGR
jgi:hypothetical protein